jgi:hypothetical protein
MTITSTTSRWNYTGDGVSVAFVYDNKIFAASDLVVTVNGVVQTLVTHYSVTGVGATVGGQVQFLAAPAVGALVQIVRAVPAIQPVNLVDGDEFPAQVINDEFDRLTILIQQGQSFDSRVLRQPPSDTAQIGYLPTKAARSGGDKLFLYDANGDPAVVPLAGLASVPVSPIMAPIVGAPSIPAALTGLGFSAFSQTLAPLPDAPAYRAALQIAAVGQRNRFGNGHFVFDQRREGAVFSVASGSTVYGLDRWCFNAQAADGVFSVQRRSDTPPPGFTHYMRLTTTTADAAIGAAQIYLARQLIEGSQMRDFAWGTANAAPAALQFLMRASLAGQYGGAIQNGAVDRSYPFSFVMNAPNVWEAKTLIVPGDIAGAWPINNGTALALVLDLGVGTRGAVGGWQAGNLRGANGDVSLVSTLNATLDLAGVQFERGNVATPFEWVEHGADLARMQRYFQKTQPEGTAAQVAMGRAGALAGIAYVGGVQNHLLWEFAVEMRGNPTIAFMNVDIATANIRDITVNGDVGVVSVNGGLVGTTRMLGVFGNLAVSNVYAVHAAADAEL